MSWDKRKEKKGCGLDFEEFLEGKQGVSLGRLHSAQIRRMDEELSDLLNELERVQTRDLNRNVLNERTCIEILYKLIKKRGLNLVTSLDGETFYTRKYLLDKIRSLLSTEGRVSIHSVSKAMKIYMEVMLKLVKELERDTNYIFYKDDIMTRRYIDDVFDNINRELQDLHIMELMKVSQRTDLSIEFIKEEIKQRTNEGRRVVKGSIVFESNNNPLIISDTYFKIIEYIVKGTLLVAKKPLSLDQIIDIRIRDTSIIMQVARDLIKKKWVKGFISGSTTFTPEAFVQEEVSNCVNYFRNNGYLEIERVRDVLKYSDATLDLKSKKVLAWAKSNLSGDNIILLDDSIIINASKLEIIGDNILHSCFELDPGYIYISHLLPHILTREINTNFHFDLVKLLKKLKDNPAEVREANWLLVTFDEPDSFHISNPDRSHFKIPFDFEKDKDEQYQPNFHFDSDTHLFNNKASNTLLFLSNFNLIILSKIICKFQNFLFNKLENIITSMVLPRFQLLPTPAPEFKPNKSKGEIQNSKRTLAFINQLVSKNNIKSAFLSEFKQEWSEMVNDNPNNTEIFASSNSYNNTHNAAEADFNDLLWNLILGPISPFIAHIYNKRMKFIYDPSNISRTFHIEDE